jgi:hypothetical protein
MDINLIKFISRKPLEVFMQFVGGKGIALFVLILLNACAIGFGSGLLIGRQFPAHHYEHMQEGSHYLYDANTGHVCDFWPVTPNTPNPIDKAFTPSKPDYSGYVNAANSTIPPCN